MPKENQLKGGFRLQENDSLTSVGWLVWLLCLALSIGGSLTFLAWAKGDLEINVPGRDTLFNENS